MVVRQILVLVHTSAALVEDLHFPVVLAALLQELEPITPAVLAVHTHSRVALEVRLRALVQAPTPAVREAPSHLLQGLAVPPTPPLQPTPAASVAPLRLLQAPEVSAPQPAVMAVRSRSRLALQQRPLTPQAALSFCKLEQVPLLVRVVLAGTSLLLPALVGQTRCEVELAAR